MHIPTHGLDHAVAQQDVYRLGEMLARQRAQHNEKMLRAQEA